MGTHRAPSSGPDTRVVLTTVAALTTGGGAAALVELIHTIDKVRARAGQVEEQVRSRLATTQQYRKNVDKSLRDLHRQITTIPTPTAIPGPPGPPGRAVVKTVVVTPKTPVKPAPATPSQTPTCRLPLAGMCLDPKGIPMTEQTPEQGTEQTPEEPQAPESPESYAAAEVATEHGNEEWSGDATGGAEDSADLGVPGEPPADEPGVAGDPDHGLPGDAEPMPEDDGTTEQEPQGAPETAE